MTKYRIVKCWMNKPVETVMETNNGSWANEYCMQLNHERVDWQRRITYKVEKIEAL